MNDRRTPVGHRRAFATLGAGLLLSIGSLIAAAAPATAAPPSATPSASSPSASTPAAAAPPAVMAGTACLPGEGVTIGVDFAPGTDEVKVGCAVGEQATISAAGAAAGFSFAPTTGFLTTIDGVLSPATGYWAVYITTADGNPGGTLTKSWTFAQTGIDGGPLAVDTKLLFDLVPDMNAPEETPRITPTGLAAATAGNPSGPAASTSGGASAGSGAAPSSATATSPAAATSSNSTVWLVVIAVLILAALAGAAVFIARRRSARSDD